MPGKVMVIAGGALIAYTKEQGVALVTAARSSIELYLRNPHFDRKSVKDSLNGFSERYGVFVTLEHHHTNTLRGCIGFLYGAYSVRDSIVDSAIAAAFDDPRFVPISHYELDDIVVEVSILSEPKSLGGTALSRKSNLKIGRDGLIIEYGMYRGLLLPNVALEEHFGKEAFLGAVCEKAGLQTDYWKQPNVKVQRFETQIFKEAEPSGEVDELSYTE